MDGTNEIELGDFVSILYFDFFLSQRSTVISVDFD